MGSSIEGIQIIRDTHGGETKCHKNFFAASNSDFKTLGSKKSCSREQDLAVKETLLHFAIQSNLIKLF